VSSLFRSIWPPLLLAVLWLLLAGLDASYLYRLASMALVFGLLAASANDLQSVDGIGSMWARHVREGLSQLAESTIADPLT